MNTRNRKRPAAARKLNAKERDTARRKRNRRLTSSKNAHWCTPPAFLELVRELGPIGLDPCGNEHSTVGAAVEWWGRIRGKRALLAGADRLRDGLAESWTGYGLVFVNPPYGTAIPKWITKMLEEARKGVEIVALVPARVDTAWYQDGCVPPASDELVQVRGRLVFVNIKGAGDPAMFPSAVVYHGPRAALFRRIFRKLGKVWGERS